MAEVFLSISLLNESRDRLGNGAENQQEIKAKKCEMEISQFGAKYINRFVG